MEPLTRDFARHGVRLYLADGGRALVAIPGVDVLDVVEIARVGTHDARADGWREVQGSVGRIASQAPFDIVFADEAGLGCVFGDVLSVAAARSTADILVDELGGALEMMMDDVMSLEDEAGDDTELAAMFASYLRSRRRFRLWWD
ncbi:MAG: hypothetical protein H0T89_09440 [Deltaproteobacteria bacterium]|nr:hypothetical protein [Deltaproteobacteria bacterium]MDQ3299033.1 hypothetical protein [Myxococcota bacterium]